MTFTGTHPALTNELSMVTVAGGVQLSVATSGNTDGKPIVFLHGFLQSHLAWLPQLDSQLADKYHLVAPDLRGHGDSGKPADPESYQGSEGWVEDLRSVLQWIGHPATIVAWSYAGYIVGDYLSRYGTDLIDSIMLTGAIIRKDDTTAGWVGPGLRDHVPGLQSEKMLDRIAATEAFAKDCSCLAVDERLQSALNAASMCACVPARRAMLDRIVDNDAAWAKCAVPVCVVQGQEDTVILAGGADRHIVSLLPHVRHHLIAGVGHTPFLEDPTAFNELLDRFIARR